MSETTQDSLVSIQIEPTPGQSPTTAKPTTNFSLLLSEKMSPGGSTSTVAPVLSKPTGDTGVAQSNLAKLPIVTTEPIAAVRQTKAHTRMFSHSHGKLEALCEDYIERHAQQEKDVESVMRLYADEYAKMCIVKRDLCVPPTLHAQFASVCEDFQTMSRFEISGVSEHENLIKSKVYNLNKEAFKRLQVVALSILGSGSLVTGVTKCSDRTYFDASCGLVIQKWPGPTAAKRYGKSLSRMARSTLNLFTIPLFIVAEVVGVTFSVASIPPLEQVIRDPPSNSAVALNVEAVMSEQRLPFDWAHVSQHSLFARGLDGRLYCLYAHGCIHPEFSPEFLHQYPGIVGSEEFMDGFAKNLDRAATETVASSRSNFVQASKSLHRYGLSVKHLQQLHGHLSKQERIRENAVGTMEDTNLTAALAAVIAEILARTVKVILRQYWAEHIVPRIGDLSINDLALEMAASAHQLVDALILEKHPSRMRGADQLYTKMIELSYQLIPKDKNTKDKDLIWEENLISEPHIAKRVAHMTGLTYHKGVIAGTAISRFVRCVTFELREDRQAVVRGRQLNVMKRLVAQIKLMRGSSSSSPASPANPSTASAKDLEALQKQLPELQYTHFPLTILLADVFHQATGRMGTQTRRPADIFEHSIRSDERRHARANSDGDAPAPCRDDDPKMLLKELEIRRILALQAIFREGQKRGLLVDQTSASASPSVLDTPTGTPPAAPLVTLHTTDVVESTQAAKKATAAANASPLFLLRADEAQAANALKATGAVSQTEVFECLEHFFDMASRQSKVATSTKTHVRIISQRCHVLSLCSKYFVDTRISVYIDQTLAALEGLRKEGDLDVKLAIHLWIQLYDATIEQEAARGTSKKVFDALQRKIEFIGNVFGDNTLQIAAAHNDVGATMLRLNELNKGRMHFELAFKTLQTVAPTNASTFAAANNLGCTYFRLADAEMDPAAKRRRWSFLKFKLPGGVERFLAESEDAFQFVLSNRRFVEGETISDVCNNLGSILMYRGRFGGAIKYFEESLQITKGLYSDDAPERLNPLRNLKNCEKRLLSNASLWIACFWRRIQAKKQLQLLKNGSKHVTRFQKIGRGYLDRVKLFQVYERKIVRRMGRGNLLFGGGGSSYQDQLISGSFDEVPNLYPVASTQKDTKKDVVPFKIRRKNSIQKAAPANSGSASHSRKSSFHEETKDAPGFIADEDEEDAENDEDDEMRADEVALLQRVGRGLITRGMLHRLWSFRQKKKNKQ